MSASKLLAPPVALCQCGHEAAAHRHYRPGTDCGACDCGRLVRARRPGLRERLRRLAHAPLADRAPLLLLALVVGGLLAGIALGAVTRDHAFIGGAWTDLHIATTRPTTGGAP